LSGDKLLQRKVDETSDACQELHGFGHQGQLNGVEEVEDERLRITNADKHSIILR
jgi:hypothetical protein